MRLFAAATSICAFSSMVLEYLFIVSSALEYSSSTLSKYAFLSSESPDCNGIMASSASSPRIIPSAISFHKAVLSVNDLIPTSAAFSAIPSSKYPSRSLSSFTLANFSTSALYSSTVIFPAFRLSSRSANSFASHKSTDSSIFLISTLLAPIPPAIMSPATLI